MPNGDDDKKRGRKKARKNVKALGSLSRRRGVLPSDVSSRNIGLGTAIKELGRWPGTSAHNNAMRNKSKDFKEGYKTELRKNRESSKKKLKKVKENLEEYNYRNRFRSEDNKKVKKQQF